MVEFEFRDGYCELSEDGVDIDQHNRFQSHLSMIKESEIWAIYMVFAMSLGGYLVITSNSIIDSIPGVFIILSPITVPEVKEWRLKRKGYSFKKEIPMAQLDAVGFHYPEASNVVPLSDSGFPAILFQYYDDDASHTVDGKKVRQVLFHHRSLSSDDTSQNVENIFNDVREWASDNGIRTEEVE